MAAVVAVVLASVVAAVVVVDLHGQLLNKSWKKLHKQMVYDWPRIRSLTELAVSCKKAYIQEYQNLMEEWPNCGKLSCNLPRHGRLEWKRRGPEWPGSRWR